MEDVRHLAGTNVTRDWIVKFLVHFMVFVYFFFIYSMLGNHVGKLIRVLSWGLSRVKMVRSYQAVELKPTISLFPGCKIL